MTVWKLHMIIQKWEESLGRIYIPIKVKGLSMRVYCTEIVYLASQRFFQGISRNGSLSKYKSLLKKRTMWTHTSHTFLLNVVLKNNQKNSQTNKQILKILKGVFVWKVTVSRSEVHSEPWQTSMMRKIKTVPYFDKKNSIMFDRVLNTLMMIMNPARYWESFSHETEILFISLAK